MKDKNYNIDFEAVSKGFGEMADIYDELQSGSPIVRNMRQKFYNVVLETLAPPAKILELNCGSGIDAHYLADKGYNVLATDVSDKMLENAVGKGYKPNLTFEKINFTGLSMINGTFDIIISNFGGLNCFTDLEYIAVQADRLLIPGGYFIATVMPKYTLWELALIFRGEFTRGLRRPKGNTIANVGGSKINVTYYSPPFFYKHFRKHFFFIKTKALSVFSPPPPALNWHNKHIKLSRALEKIDIKIENFYPCAFFADYYIIVMRKII